MDRLERISAERYERQEMLNVAFKGLLAGLWTATPGIVNSIDKLESQGTIDVQPALTSLISTPDGQTSQVALPLLLDCPVVLIGGGGCVATFPISVNDECLVVLTGHSIDNWWANGGVQAQAEKRLHDLSDGFAIVGLRSKPNWMKGYSSSTAQLRSLDGLTYAEVDPANQQINLVAPKGILATTPFLHVTGAVKSGWGTDGQVDAQNHTHPQGADTHGDSEQDTGAPIAEAAFNGP